MMTEKAQATIEWLFLVFLVWTFVALLVGVWAMHARKRFVGRLKWFYVVWALYASTFLIAVSVYALHTR